MWGKSLPSNLSLMSWRFYSNRIKDAFNIKQSAEEEASMVIDDDIRAKELMSRIESKQ